MNITLFYGISHLFVAEIQNSHLHLPEMSMTVLREGDVRQKLMHQDGQVRLLSTMQEMHIARQLLDANLMAKLLQA